MYAFLISLLLMTAPLADTGSGFKLFLGQEVKYICPIHGQIPYHDIMWERRTIHDDDLVALCPECYKKFLFSNVNHLEIE